MAISCTNIQKSLEWCEGRPQRPGIKRRAYYTNKQNIVTWPVLLRDANGRVTSAVLSGSFALKADQTWKFIDFISAKSQLTSDPQGEYPSQTQLNKLVMVHPGVGTEAAAAAAYLNNSDNVFLVEDMDGNFRVVGSELWQSVTTVSQDNGQGPTGSAATTISVEATDECPAPFYVGDIVTEDGTITPGSTPGQVNYQQQQAVQGGN